MYKVIDETVVKVIILLSLSLILVFLAFTGTLFHLGEFDETYMLLHKSAGALLIILTLIHIYIKRNKVKKISEEFIGLLLNKHIGHTNNKETLLKVLKQKTLEELSLMFNWNMQDLLLTFENNSIEVSDPTQKLGEIAKSNSKDPYKIFILILKEQVQRADL